MTKLCVDCKYITHPNHYDCSHPNNISLVTGEATSPRAGDVRSDPALCGLEGKWFEVNTERFSQLGSKENPRPCPHDFRHS